MRGTLIVVTGTGTDVGKTHVAAALVLRAATELEVCGFKPVESGVSGMEGPDGKRLREASTFHVKRVAPYLLRRPVSPHLAARDEGIMIGLEPIRSVVEELRTEVSNLVVELAGGLFSPLSDDLLMIDVVCALKPTRVVLVAPDRLGVLHDLGATTRAAGDRIGAPIGIVLNAPPEPDASTGTNGAELPIVTRVPRVATLPRADVNDLARHPELDVLFTWCFGTAYL